MTVLFKPHYRLEKEVESLMKRYGYDTAELTYHEHMPQSIQTQLRKKDDPTSLLLRTRADRICVKRAGETLMLEVKTHASRKNRDCTIELLPLANHISDFHDFQARCVYAYRNDYISNTAHGFFAHEAPKMVTKIFIPSKYQRRDKYFRKICHQFFPKAEIINIGKVSSSGKNTGSGDPFVVIPHAAIHSCKTFEELLIHQLNGTNN
jgi:hypothetical protein